MLSCDWSRPQTPTRSVIFAWVSGDVGRLGTRLQPVSLIYIFCDRHAHYLGNPLLHGASLKMADRAEAGEGVSLVNGHPWRIGQRYKNLKYLTTGSNGVLCHAVDTHTSERVIISKRDGLYSSHYCHRNLRDLQITSRLTKIDDGAFPKITDIISHPSSSEADMTELYVVQPAMEVNLEEVLASGSKLDENQVRVLMYQLFRTLNLIHSAGITHRCVHPHHLLINSECELKICDFRQAAVSGVESDPNFELMRLTDSYRVSHLWYWAPEVLINEQFTTAADIWSAGCILAELLLGKRVFEGSDVKEQFSLFFEHMGIPSQSDLAFIKSESSRAVLASLEPRSSTFENCFSGMDSTARDLLEHLLVLNPQKRFTAKQALCHAYFSSLHDPEDEPTYVADRALTDVLLLSEASIDFLRHELSQEVKQIVSQQDTNKGYVMVNGRPWFVGNRYQGLKLRYTGSNGAICTAIDTQRGPDEMVVITKRDGLYDRDYCQRNLREIQFLCQLQHNLPKEYFLISQILDIICRPPSLEGQASEIYVVQTALESNLQDIIQSGSLEQIQIKLLMYELLVSLKLLHSANVVHRCLRPRHILITSDCSLAVCDLRRATLANTPDGACNLYNWKDTSTTHSWRYLAPEVLCYEQQSTACDIWSAGCIFGEMLAGRPMFPTGANIISLFTLIFGTLGLPSDEDLARMKSDSVTTFLKDIPTEQKETLDDIFKDKDVDPNAVDLLKKMLVFNPDKRISAEEALNDVYFKEFHDSEEEPIYKGRDLRESIVLQEMSIEQLRTTLLEEVKHLQR